MDTHHLARRLTEADVVIHESTTLRSGRRSELYCDIKKAYGEPAILNELADALSAQLRDEETCIAATGYGGIPLAAVIAAKTNRFFTAVRDARKAYGTNRYVEGHIPTKDDVVVVVDDVLTTGSSILSVLSPLFETEAVVSRAVVVVKRGEVELPVPHDFLFSLEELTGAERAV